MSGQYIRVYHELDVNEIKGNLLIYGDVSGLCFGCQATDVKLNDPVCPKCKTEFKFIAFRHVKSHLPKLKKISAERPSIKIIDHDDFTRQMSAIKARDFLK